MEQNRLDARGIPPRIQVDEIRKSFGRVAALQGASLEMGAGEVLGLAGDNAAGKSTLMKILAGGMPPDSGRILCDGREVAFQSPRDARALGIEMVYQDLALCDHLDVARNLFLGREIHSWGWLSLGDMHRRAAQHLESLGIRIGSTAQPVRELSGGQRQAIAIARALLFQARVLILDEPTAALAVREVELVLELITRLGRQGVSVVLITHRLQDFLRVCHRVAVLRMGRVVANLTAEQLNLTTIVSSIIGDQTDSRRHAQP